MKCQFNCQFNKDQKCNYFISNPEFEIDENGQVFCATRTKRVKYINDLSSLTDWLSDQEILNYNYQFKFSKYGEKSLINFINNLNMNNSIMGDQVGYLSLGIKIYYVGVEYIICYYNGSNVLSGYFCITSNKTFDIDGKTKIIDLKS